MPTVHKQRDSRGLEPTCQLVANAHAGAGDERNVGKAATPVATCWIADPPVRLEGLGILPPLLVVVQAPNADIHFRSSGHFIPPHLHHC